MSVYFWKKFFGLVLVGLAAIPILDRPPPVSSGAARAPAYPVADEFYLPLGYRDGAGYGPRVQYNGSGQLIENTNYGVKNPDMQGGTCFGVGFEQIYHAGTDWYREDGTSTAGAEVTAIANGQVFFADPNMNYPGLVVIIEHTLPSGQKIYSVYAHLDDTSLEVEAGQIVTAGQRLGTVTYMNYSGRYPEYHPSGDDSHLHFELRYFYNGRALYPNNPSCNGLIPGRGYTYPQYPDNFPDTGVGYTDPVLFLQRWTGDKATTSEESGSN